MENKIEQLRTQLHRNRLLGEILKIASVSILVGVSVFVFSLDQTITPFIIAGAFFVGCLGVAVLLGRFKKPSMSEITRFLDRTVPFMEESASLLVKDSFTGPLEKWQTEKIAKRLKKRFLEVELPGDQLKKASQMAGLLLIVSLILLVAKPVLNQNLMEFKNQGSGETQAKEEVLNSSVVIPQMDGVEITVNPPFYTDLEGEQSDFENISVPEKSAVAWKVRTNENTEDVRIVFSNGEAMMMNLKDGEFSGSIIAEENRIYQFQLSNADTTVSSAFRSLEVVPDQPPGFVILKPIEKRDFITPEKRTFDIVAVIGDDYGVSETEIRATLARGSGENVRFREQTVLFTELSGIGSEKVRAGITLNADSLEMEPGDELYFFITARDNKPDPQLARSDTYFIIYADSGGLTTIEVAGFGVDLLPEYFRSQRQIIIDTEQLLVDEPNISREEFNRRSENIGYDQNLLRKRYGEYLGQEDEMGGSTGGQIDIFEGEDHDHAGEDPAETEADDEHVHEEEINESGLSNAQSTAASIIPEEFFHDHGAAEMNTLFAQSPRAMLKEALDNMWNAEMYLRTRQPADALPFEYAALELLKAVQQANRQYTRKAGYTLPPIPVDENRLTGTYDDFADPDGSRQTDRPENPLENIRLLVLDQTLTGSEFAMAARGLTAEADLSEEHRLFLLNRIRTVENEGRDTVIEEQIIQLINRISRNIQHDPTPKTIPSIRNIQTLR